MIKLFSIAVLTTLLTILNAGTIKSLKSNNTAKNSNQAANSFSEKKVSEKALNNKDEDIVNDKNIVIDKKTDDNYHEIISTMSACKASCCANNTVDSKNGKSSKKSKKFGWFSRKK